MIDGVDFLIVVLLLALLYALCCARLWKSWDADRRHERKVHRNLVKHSGRTL